MHEKKYKQRRGEKSFHSYKETPKAYTQSQHWDKMIGSKKASSVRLVIQNVNYALGQVPGIGTSVWGGGGGGTRGGEGRQWRSPWWDSLCSSMFPEVNTKATGGKSEHKQWCHSESITYLKAILIIFPSQRE